MSISGGSGRLRPVIRDSWEGTIEISCRTACLGAKDVSTPVWLFKLWNFCRSNIGDLPLRMLSLS